MKLAAAIIVIDPDGKILLLDRAWPPFGYGLVGGEVEADETNMEGAIRESIEEIGVEFQPHQFQYHGTKISADGKWQVILYKIELKFEIDIRINEEHYSYLWTTDVDRNNLEYAGNTKKFIDNVFTTVPKIS